MNESPFLTIPEVAAVMRCCEKTVRRAIARGEIQARHFGGRWLVHELDIPGAMTPRRPPTPRARRLYGEGITGAAARELLAARERSA